MGEMNIDRRTFVGAMGALGALSLAGVGLGCAGSGSHRGRHRVSGTGNR